MKQLFIHGRIFTGSLPLASAFAVEGDRFAAAGTDEEILALRREGDLVIDLEGDFVCPGFHDSHMHLLNYGYAMENCDLSAHTGSLQDMIDALKDFAQSHPEGWIRGRGFNQDYFAESHEMPTRYDLDQAAADRPVCIVRCCGHCLVVNSFALELLGIDGTQPQADGGHYDLDANGKPLGIFRDAAMGMVYSRIPAPTKDDVKRMLAAGCRGLNAYGVTACQTDDLLTFSGLPWETVLEAYRELEAEGQLTVRIYEQSQFTDVPTLSDFIDKGYQTGKGTDFLRIGPLKMLGDGSLGARTAYLSGTYADDPSQKGLALFTQKEFDEMVECAVSHGMQVAIHAIGDGILDRILCAYEKAFAKYPVQDHRCGIVHVQITRPEQLQKMKELALHAYAQTIFIDYDAHIVRDRVGNALAETSYAFGTMQKLGITLSNGTDCPVEKPDALRGIQCAVTRQPIAQDVPAYLPQEALTVEEALQSYTMGSAYAAFAEDRMGQIAPGYLADFVRLGADPFTTDPQSLHRIPVKETWVGGKPVKK